MKDCSFKFNNSQPQVIDFEVEIVIREQAADLDETKAVEPAVHVFGVIST